MGIAGYHDGMKLMALLMTLLMAGAVGAGAADTLKIFGHEWSVPVADLERALARNDFYQ